ncbi:hypothetical protein HY404_02500 [Candidatus Microgenomates bacterium]|nr:hypothetical protein [Candidatus Microgenomates bacterium]
MNILKNWKVIILIFIFGLLFTTSPAYATIGTLNLGDFQLNISKNQYNKESFDFQSLTGLMGGLTTMLVGCANETCPDELKIGAIPATGNAIAGMVTHPPASGVSYLADLGRRMNIVQPAYAQTGFGFNAINPFQMAWSATRNFTYLLFVIAAVGFGVAIMLRTKISPQAVITIQSALPRIVIALIFVTFSYAIVGFIIDLTYLGFGLLVFGLHSTGLTVIIDPSARYQEYTSAGFAQTIGFISSQGMGGAWNIAQGLGGLSAGIGAAIAGILAAVVLLLTKIPSAAGTVLTLGQAIGAVASPFLPVLLMLILAVLFFLIRVLFALARSYLLLLFYLILAPLFILWGAIRGEGIWNSWLRGVLANVLVFPTVGIIIFLTGVLIELVGQAGGALWTPPYVGGGATIIQGMIGLGAVMLLPTIPDIINQLLGTKPIPIQLPQAQAQIQQALGGITQGVTRRFFG